MDLEPAVLMIIMLVAIGLAIGLIYTVGQGSFGSPIDKIRQIFGNASESVNPGESYDICEDYMNKRISQKDFETLLQSMYRGNCRINSTTFQISFSLKQEDFNKLLDGIGIGDKGSKVFYRYDIESLGIGAVIVKGNAGTYPLKMYDRIEILYRGSPDKDIIIQLKEEGCDPYDQNCESMCSYMEEICDPLCYQNDQSEKAPCDIDCVDKDGDGNITGADQDGVCDFDCYNNYFDPQRAYDPDCIAKNKDIFDGTCDPDSNGVQDGVCDPDCAMNQTLCDPDCNGLEYEGNPKALLSSACYVCDKTCNGFCSMSCKKEDNDTDCPNGFKGFNNLTECCGNGKCNTDEGEDCKNCNKDCPAQGVTCESLGKICCPSPTLGGDIYGCSDYLNLPEGGLCTCSEQCGKNLSCSVGHCCPMGSMWSAPEKKCINRTDVVIVALKTNLKKVYSDDDIKRLEEKIEEFRNALQQDGLGSQFFYLDSDEVETVCGKKVTSPGDWTNIYATTVPLVKKLESKYLIIIGGHARFPQSDVARTGSDAAYGDINGDGRYLMDISVGRFPDPNNGDLAVIINALDTSIKLHKSGGLDLSNHIAPIMSCGGHDNRPWNSGRCFCQAVFGSSCQACGGCCGNIGPSSLSGKDFAMILAHGPGASASDYYQGGGIVAGGTGWMGSLDVSDAVWMPMACGGGHLKLKQTTSGSITMTFLKKGGAVFIGSTDLNSGSMGSCPVPGGDNCIGSLYVEIATRFQVGKRIGDAYREGKNAYFPKYHCPDGQSYHYQISCLYGDPTLKIKAKW